MSLNRIGSNPLEHKFGLLRIRSKYKNSITKLFNEASKVEIMNHIEKSVFFDVVNRRKNTFGELLNLDGDYHGGSSIFNNKLIAYSLMWKFGFNVSKLRYKPGVCEKEYAYGAFIHKISKLVVNNSQKLRKVMSSRSISVANSNTKIRSRQENQEIFIADSKHIVKCKKCTNDPGKVDNPNPSFYSQPS